MVWWQCDEWWLMIDQLLTSLSVRAYTNVWFILMVIMRALQFARFSSLATKRRYALKSPALAFLKLNLYVKTDILRQIWLRKRCGFTSSSSWLGLPMSTVIRVTLTALLLRCPWQQRFFDIQTSANLRKCVLSFVSSISLRPPAGRQMTILPMPISQQPFNRSWPNCQQLLAMSNKGKLVNFSSFAHR